ncbi:MAG: GH32 C-terminal domain-containing protein, partial [Clostridia bacterium]
RDPFVYFDEDRQQFCMLIAGRLKNDMPINNRGCTLVAYSKDMRHWELSKEPFYAPNAYFTHECPDLFKMGDWWYLVFSEFTDKILTTYRMSKSINGPWITPKINSFDGHCFYAAKSVSDGKRRIMFGWNCIKDKEKDLNFWQWGGNIIAHEIVQNEDGTLYVKCPTEVKNNYHKDFPLSVGKSFGKVIQDCDKMILGQNGEKSVQIFNAMPQNCKIEFDFVTTDDIGDFGLLLRETSNMDNYYEVRFEPMYNRLAFDRWPRRDGTEHTLVDCERFCPIEVGTTNSVIVLAQGSVLEVYVNNKVAMSTRMFDFTEGNFGFCVNNTQVIFSNIKISE